MTAPGIPNNYVLSTSCFGDRLKTIEDQAFAAVAMGFRAIELGLSESPVPLTGFEDTRRETGVRLAAVVAVLGQRDFIALVGEDTTQACADLLLIVDHQNTT